jgi:4-hydroxyphenylpyruvate dioxygenase
MSLGRCFAGHSLSHKLDMAQKYGYQGIELFHEDLADVAEQQFSQEACPDGPSAAAQLAAAHHIFQMCRSRNLEIVCLQPFMHYDGLVDRSAHALHLKKLELWFLLARALKTDLIQIPSNFLPADQVSPDMDLIVEDLIEVANMGLQQSPPFRFAYESLCWGTRVDTWEKCWDVVRRVDKPNFGMCLDTYNIAGRIYADPTSPDGKNPNAEEVVRQSMARLVTSVDVEKVFYVQVVDAERLAEPLVAGHAFYNADQPPRMSWSRNCRLFYGEKDRGAYLPVKEISKAFFQGLGFKGWVSLELFNRRMSDPDPAVPEELAARGAASWMKLRRDMGLDFDVPSHYRRISASL